MLRLDAKQSQVLRQAIFAACAFWVCSQIADSSFMERVWNQLSILALGAGAMKVLILEGIKANRSHGA